MLAEEMLPLCYSSTVYLSWYLSLLSSDSLVVFLTMKNISNALWDCNNATMLQMSVLLHCVCMSYRERKTNRKKQERNRTVIQSAVRKIIKCGLSG